MPVIARAVLAALLTLGAVASPAGAAVVARGGGAVLKVKDERDRGLCVDLERVAAYEGGGSSSCAPAPLRPYRAIAGVLAGDDGNVVAGAVPAATARVEAELDDGRRIGAATVAGRRYRGRYAGRVRFFLFSVPSENQDMDEAGGVALLRLYDEAGRLLGAVEAESYREHVVRGPVRLLTQRRRGASIVVSALVQRAFAPTPLTLDRFEPRLCLQVRERRRNSSGSSSGCQGPGPYRPPLDLQTQPGCGKLRSVLYGFVGDEVTGVRLRLGSGRTLTTEARTLPAALGETGRYVAAILPRGEAVRRAAAIGEPGVQDLGLAPGGLPCVSRDGGSVGFAIGVPGDRAPLPAGAEQQVAAESDGHRLVVRDAEHERLCVGIDALRADGSDCDLPAIDPGYVFPEQRRGMTGAVVPAEVARVVLPGGRRVDTVEGAGYTGRYAGRVRFFLAPLPRGTSGRARLLDASGAVVGTTYVGAGSLKPTAGPLTIAHGRSWRLVAARYDESVCIGVALRGERADCDAPFYGTGAYAVAGCAPRVTVLYGTLERGIDEVTAVLRGGRLIPARIVRVPRRVGRGRGFVLELPRTAEVRALRFDGREARFPLLPAARQCGYWVYEPFI